MPILIVQLLPLTSESEEYFRCVMEAERQNFSMSLGQGMAQNVHFQKVTSVTFEDFSDCESKVQETRSH